MDYGYDGPLAYQSEAGHAATTVASLIQPLADPLGSLRDMAAAIGSTTADLIHPSQVTLSLHASHP